MTKQVQRRRGTATQHTSFTGAEGEISVNTTNKSVHVHDGSTAGGIEAARADLTNVADADLNTALSGNTLASLTITSADINGGSLDGTTIGANSAAAITGTTITGTSFVSSGDMTFGDNDKAIFGAGSDLQIYHDGSNSYINESGTGNLFIDAANYLTLRNTNGESYVAAQANGYVQLFYNGSQKLSTTSTGISVTGNATFADNGKAIFGAGSDLQIYHSGTHSFIEDKGTGNLYIDGSSAVIIRGDTASTISATFNDAGAVTIRNNGDTKLATTSTGIDVTGTVTADGLTVDGAASIGSSTAKTKFYSDSTYSGIYNGANLYANESIYMGGGNLYFYTATDQRMLISSGGDISFYEDTGTTAKLFWDASQEKLEIDSVNANPLILERNGGTDANVSIQFNCATNDWYAGTNPSNNFAIGTSLDQTNAPFQINSSGHVGIGTSSPGNRLAVNGSSTHQGAVAKIVRNQAAASNNTYTFEVDSSAHTSNMSSGGAFAVDVNSGRALTINGFGRVGIGTSLPDKRLDVLSGTSNSDIAAFTGVSSGRGLVISTFANTSDDAGVDFDAISGNGAISFSTGGSEAIRITSSGSVGIGTSSPSGKLHVESNDASQLSLTRTGVGTFGLGVVSGDALIFQDGSTERMRIDSSGNLLVGTTDNGPSTAGIKLFNGNYARFVRATANGPAVFINGLTNDGELLRFQKDGTTVGSIGVDDNASDTNKTIYISSGNSASSLDVGFKFDWSANQITPCQAGGANRDNAVDMGSSSVRFDDIYATNGTIQTSDQNEKQDIAELSDAEQRVAVAAKGLLRKFRWKDAVAEKGDEARTHFGIIAQDLQAAFAAEGLDAGDYAMFIHTTWTDEETGEERSRMGVRYSELLAFIIAAI